MALYIKRYAILLLTVMALGLMAMPAKAASVLVRGGIEHITNSDENNSSIVGADVFFYEGRRVELFVGLEQNDFKNAISPISQNQTPDDVKFSLGITALDFGLRWKPAMSSRWRPYLSLGGIAGKADYKIDSNQTNKVLLSTGSGSTTFVEPRAGIGMDIGLGERWSIGVEANVTGAIPSFNAVFADYYTGQIQDVKVNDKGNMFSLLLGLRYSF